MEQNHYVLYKRQEPNRKDIFYFYYYDDCGKKIRRSTGCSSKTKARDYVANLIAKGFS